jgi:DNA invertase Pin-like site-specific DNA recombinase
MCAKAQAQQRGLNARRQQHVATARVFGWQESNIVVIEDFASGGPGKMHRPGMQKLQSLIRNREVGAVITDDVTRISRMQPEVDDFVALCRASDCILIFGNGIVNPVAA